MTNRIAIFLCLFMLVTGKAAVARNAPPGADSLRKVLFKTDDLQEKLRIYIHLVNIYNKVQSDTADLYISLAYSLSKQVDDPSLQGKVYYAMGNRFVIQNKLDLALADYQVASRLFERAADTLNFTRIHLLIGNILSTRGDVGAAMGHFMEGLALAEKNHYYSLLPHLTNNIGEMYQQSDNRKKAMDYYARAIELFSRIGDSVNLGNVLNNIGTNYHNLGDNEMARH
jgi:tetratricopeptide (TPR) repeat protein